MSAYARRAAARARLLLAIGAASAAGMGATAWAMPEPSAAPPSVQVAREAPAAPARAPVEEPLPPAQAAPEPSATRPRAQAAPPLFASHEPIDVTLSADFAQLREDRLASPDRPATVIVTDARGARVRIAAELRTRGAFRLDPANCSFPPLRVDVDAGGARGTVFEGQDDLKIVASCRPGRDSYEQLVLLEYLAYRAYALVTDTSFRVRLARLTFEDESGSEEPATRSGFFIEDDEGLARRLGATVFDLPEGKNLPASAFDPVSATSTAVFQYLIGNADWSDVAAHNVEVFDRGGVAVAVPYDFDFSGFVDAPYAAPPSELGLRSVRDRLYRGWCRNDIVERGVLDRFRDQRAAMLALVEDMAGLDESVRRRALRYLEEGLADLETDERARRRFLRDCRPLPS